MNQKQFSGKKSSSKAIQTYLKSMSAFPGDEEVPLGGTFSHVLRTDPRYMLFSLSRHKFVAKMFEGKKRVLEIGCNEGFGTPIVAQSVGHVHGVDYYLEHIESSRRRLKGVIKNATFEAHDFLDAPVLPKFDAAFCMDVIEHIDPKQEELFFKNVVKSLKVDAPFILGSPSLESQVYASVASKEGHINCRPGAEWKEACLRYFKNVFLFSMNDEVVHTGYSKMAHYVLTLCVGPKK